MRSKWHSRISFIKSAIRIFGALLCILYNDIIILAFCFALAEILGIVEELGDNR